MRALMDHLEIVKFQEWKRSTWVTEFCLQNSHPHWPFFLGGIMDTLWTWQLTFCRGGVQVSKLVYSNLSDVFLRLFMVISQCHWVFGMFLEHHQFLCHQTVPWMFATKTCFSCHVSCQSIFKSFCHSTNLRAFSPTTIWLWLNQKSWIPKNQWWEWSKIINLLEVSNLVTTHLCVSQAHVCCNQLKKNTKKNLLSLKLTARTWKWMVGRLLTFWGPAYFQVRTVSFREGISSFCTGPGKPTVKYRNARHAKRTAKRRRWKVSWRVPPKVLKV